MLQVPEDKATLVQLSLEEGSRHAAFLPDLTGHLAFTATGGGPLLQLDAASGALLHQYGDRLTQALAVNPVTGKRLTRPAAAASTCRCRWSGGWRADLDDAGWAALEPWSGRRRDLASTAGLSWVTDAVRLCSGAGAAGLTRGRRVRTAAVLAGLVGDPAAGCQRSSVGSSTSARAPA
jgi:hypothetical protein